MRPDQISCSSRRGAPMGRPDQGSLDEVPSKSVYLSPAPIDCDGYDKGGAYWGLGPTLYVAYTSDHSFVRWVRAMDRRDAAQKLELLDSGLLVRNA
jgi:hypothetical protein